MKIFIQTCLLFCCCITLSACKDKNDIRQNNNETTTQAVTTAAAFSPRNNKVTIDDELFRIDPSSPQDVSHFVISEYHFVISDYMWDGHAYNPVTKGWQQLYFKATVNETGTGFVIGSYQLYLDKEFKIKAYVYTDMEGKKILAKVGDGAVKGKSSYAMDREGDWVATYYKATVNETGTGFVIGSYQLYLDKECKIKVHAYTDMEGKKILAKVDDDAVEGISGAFNREKDKWQTTYYKAKVNKDATGFVIDSYQFYSDADCRVEVFSYTNKDGINVIAKADELAEGIGGAFNKDTGKWQTIYFSAKVNRSGTDFVSRTHNTFADPALTKKIVVERDVADGILYIKRAGVAP